MQSGQSEPPLSESSSVRTSTTLGGGLNGLVRRLLRSGRSPAAADDVERSAPADELPLGDVHRSTTVRLLLCCWSIAGLQMGLGTNLAGEAEAKGRVLEILPVSSVSCCA